jgi:hypothetical protein
VCVTLLLYGETAIVEKHERREVEINAYDMLAGTKRNGCWFENGRYGRYPKENNWSSKYFKLCGFVPFLLKKVRWCKLS